MASSAAPASTMAISVFSPFICGTSSLLEVWRPMLHRSIRTRLGAAGCGIELDLPPVAASVPHADLERRRLHMAGGGSRPLDESDRVRRQVVLEKARVLALQAWQPVEVEMGDPDARAAVGLPDREGGRGHPLLDPER